MSAVVPPKERKTLLVYFVLLFIVFTCVFPYIAKVNNPNENVRTYMTMALVENQTFRIDEIVQRHGWVNDMAKVPDKVTGGSHVYSVKAPANSYLGLPIYWAFTKVAPMFGHPLPTLTSTPAEKAWWLRNATFALRLFTVQLPCFAFLVWFERWLRKTSPDLVLRLTAVTAAGLGTNFLGYSMMFVSHAVIAIAAFACFAAIYDARTMEPEEEEQNAPRLAFLAGLFAGLTTLYEYQALPVSVVLALYGAVTFRKPRLFLLFVLGGATNAAAMMVFQWRAFGSPFTPGHKMVENAFFRSQHAKGFYGVEMPDLTVFRNVSISPTYGFFSLSPYMWIGLAAIPVVLLLRKSKGGERVASRELRVATAVWGAAMFVLWLAISALNNWRGGWTLGPRFFGIAPPFFAFGALCALESFAAMSATKRAIARGVGGGLAVASVVSIGVVGLEYNTIPEEVSRPLVQFAWPLMKAGVVPYTLGDFFGMQSAAFWYFVCACLVAAALLSALVRDGEATRAFLVRVGVFAAALVLGLLPAFTGPFESVHEPPAAGGIASAMGLARMWEPARPFSDVPPAASSPAQTPRYAAPGRLGAPPPVHPN